MGRFISKDTYEGQLTNPLSLNQYTYGYNNPTIYVDPSGHVAIGIPLLLAGEHLVDALKETAIDMALDKLIEGDDYNPLWSGLKNFGTNLVPIWGEVRTLNKTADLVKGTGKVWTRANRMAEFEKWVENGLKVGGKKLEVNEHILNSLKKSARKDIMPDQVLDALKQKPKVADRFSWVYTDPKSGVKVFVNGFNDIVGVQPGKFK